MSDHAKFTLSSYGHAELFVYKPVAETKKKKKSNNELKPNFLSDFD